MQIEITRKGATTFMRWIIVLTLFGTVIHMSNKIDDLEQALQAEKSHSNGLHEDWLQSVQDLRDLHASCGK